MALDSFMARMMDEEEHTTEDYGWLEPNGTFHAVEWGVIRRANDYSGQEPDTRGRFAAMVEINASGMVKNSPDVIGAADYLVRRGWGASAQSTAGNRNSNKGHHQRVHKGTERVPV